MTKISAKNILTSENKAGVKIRTLVLEYHRYIHSEFMTHRVFSRNASSSRAIPVRKTLARVWADPAVPIHWGRNQSGMQARSELGALRRGVARFLWVGAGRAMCGVVGLLNLLGLHKQVANRLLEPWSWITVVVTGTEWDNFLDLRDHPDAQPEIRELAIQIKEAIKEGDENTQVLKDGEWHIPFLTPYEDMGPLPLRSRLCHSVARCARTSYRNHDKSMTGLGEDMVLHDRLCMAKPPHMSPFEHQAMAAHYPNGQMMYANLKGFISYRSHLERGLPVEEKTNLTLQEMDNATT